MIFSADSPKKEESLEIHENIDFFFCCERNEQSMKIIKIFQLTRKKKNEIVKSP